MFFILFVVAISLNVISSQLFVTSNAQEIEVKKLKEKYQIIMDKFLSDTFVGCVFKNITDESTTIFDIKYNKLSLSSEKEPYYYMKENTIVYPKLISLTFSYKAIFNESSYQGLFTMEIASIAIQETNEKNVFTPVVSIDVEEDNFSFTFDSSLEPEPKAHIENLIRTNFFEMNNELLDYTFTSVISKGNQYFYYDILNITMALSDVLGGENLLMSMSTFCGLCSDVKKKGDTVQCYYMGNIKEEKYYDRQKDIEEYDEFFKLDDYFKIFLGYQIFNESMKVDSVMSMVYTLNEKTKPEAFTTKLLAENLFHFFPNLNKIMLRNANFNVKSHFQSMNMTSFDKGNTTMLHEFYFENSNESMIILKTEFNWDLNFTDYSTHLNLCVANLRTVKIKNLSQNIMLKMENINDFKSVIDSLLMDYIASIDGLCLYKNKGIDFSEFLKLIEDVHIGKNGIFLKGSPMTY